ncbi:MULTISPECIES: LysE/ArgO family amino acid transporter [Pelosinus]|uniref:Lysine exporter protein (LYSE/YGGA) n=1 Tax=Pelosinus fermentans B4 TaxID=1149862 RepID=I9LHK9_9FIRM|nr:MULTISPECIES: LysE family transporter [Pelosinus]EIW19851.1 Lysine exporter protein (LYSE/YGGA) [Pelosinus fermentans B4]EIW21292.1 Lysine exporter protein (LYSE/YGGA) [Pelosinus fermentans A11]OAM95005.1 Lysine exporter protein (LYSE/YGGA) [Pelosinus fermentans DSM 17108]SDR21879.1 L-lysine exporter family protein LysE/ArgO [Pelosinus fermentans]
MQAFLHGMILAMGLILPLGVQNLFVFTQGAAQPTFLRALPVVITASLCDTVLIVLAVQGVSLFIASFAWIKILFLMIGVGFLAYMGWLTWNSTWAGNDVGAGKGLGVKQQIVFAVTVSLFNPHAVLDTIGVIGTSAIHYTGNEKIVFTMACILVSWCWFFLLAAIGWNVGKKKSFTQLFGYINKVSAIFMWLSAVYMIYNSVL